jgi:hypothetical protein
MKLTAFNYPPDEPTTLHRRVCTQCGRSATYDCYEVGTMVEKRRLKALDDQWQRFMKALLEED